MTSFLADTPDAIRVRGARTHNLKNIDVEVPLGKLSVITGVSGSGKSSLAFDTLFAEGRRRYLATVSAQTRALLQKLDRADVDSIEGLPPTLGLEQRVRGARRRTTLGSITEIYDYLRLLYARIGVLHCLTCHQPVTSQTREAIVAQVLKSEDRQKVLVLSPVVRCQTGTHSEVFSRIVRDGFVRARVDGELVDAASPPMLLVSKSHSIEVVVDRLIIKDGIQSRLEESIDLALEIGKGQCVLSHEVNGVWVDRLYSSRLACVTCGVSYPSIEPADFSFNSVRGACSECHGLGEIVTLVPSTDAATAASSKSKTKQKSKATVNESVLERRSICPECSGRRLARLPNAVLVQGRSLTDVTALECDRALEVIDSWMASLGIQSPVSLPADSSAGSSDPTTELSQQNWGDVSEAQVLTAKHILPEVAARLRFLCEMGMEYLSLDRAGESLSAGEYQRARLAAGLGSELTGTCFVIDEPTSGLHPRDTLRLLDSVMRLRDQGNTVILVEHDLEVIRRADHVIDIGPGAGIHGGHLIASGSPEELRLNPASITGKELHRRSVMTANQSQRFQTTEWLTLTGAAHHNIRDLTLRLPLHGIVCVTGVSGSGKSSLIMETLVPAIKKHLQTSGKSLDSVWSIATGHDDGLYRSIDGVELISRLVCIDQKPLGRAGRSTPASYSGIWDEVRKLFAKTKDARLRGFGPKRFSPQSIDGRCNRCLGRGTLAADQKSLFEWTIRCPDCLGRRFNRQTIAIRYRGMNVADVMEMSFETAADFFSNLPRLSSPITLFCDLGLGYLKLGQPSATLSGGEAQRVKLATELVLSHESPRTLFVLDEPTSGLHAVDVAMLLNVLRRLVDSGHSVIVIEHNLDLISSSDWIIDIGPEAGNEGGRVVAEGTPQEIANSRESHTGQALREIHCN